MANHRGSSQDSRLLRPSASKCCSASSTAGPAQSVVDRKPCEPHFCVLGLSESTNANAYTFIFEARYATAPDPSTRISALPAKKQVESFSDRWGVRRMHSASFPIAGLFLCPETLTLTLLIHPDTECVSTLTDHALTMRFLYRRCRCYCPSHTPSGPRTQRISPNSCRL